MNIIDRLKNQRVAQKIHYKNRVPGEKQSRIENCCRLKTNRAQRVNLIKSPGAKRASFNGLQRCGSVWVCPYDSSKISEVRKNGLQEGIDNHRAKNDSNIVIMITFTSPHYIFQSLGDVLSVQDKAFRIMKNQHQRGKYKVYKTIIKEMQSMGDYTGRELTFGFNGWHPHRHCIYFCIRASIEQLIKWQYEMTIAWLIALRKAGLIIKSKSEKHFFKRAVKFSQITDDNGYSRISSYITSVEGERWSLAQEATKGIVKTAKNGNITPFGMLEAIRHGDKHSGLYSLKFFEYSKTMHGKKQFFPSPGLNSYLDIHWKTDQEIIKDDSLGNHYSDITDPQWNEIINFDIRGEVLSWTENRNEFEFMYYLDSKIKEYQLEKTG